MTAGTDCNSLSYRRFNLEKLCEIVEEKKPAKKIVKPGYKAKAKSDKKPAFDKPKTFKKK